MYWQNNELIKQILIMVKYHWVCWSVWAEVVESVCCVWFWSSDTCYILSFAIIMLNTSLHNPNVKDKTTLERFISMNRGINNGQDLPNDLLTVSSQSQSALAGHMMLLSSEIPEQAWARCSYVLLLWSQCYILYNGIKINKC